MLRIVELCDGTYSIELSMEKENGYKIGFSGIFEKKEKPEIMPEPKENGLSIEVKL